MQLVKRAVIADAAGVTVATVSRFMKKGGELEPAKVGSLIDIENPVAVRFIEARLGHHNDPTYKAPRNHATRVTPPAEDADAELKHRYNMDKLAKRIRDLADKPLSELVRIFGDDVQFEMWLKALKEIEAIDEKRIKNAELRAELVRRDAVQLGIIDPVDELFRKVLQDGCKTMATKAAAMAKSGRDTPEITEQLREIISTYFKAAQRNMLQAIERLAKKANDA